MILLLGSALAAVPFALPPGEAASDWTAALALGGFVAGDPGPGPGAALVAEGEGWRLIVHDPRGGVRSITVTRPRTVQERQDLVWMAQSLLDPVVEPMGTPSRPPSAPPVADGAPPPAPSPRAPTGDTVPRAASAAPARRSTPRTTRPAPESPPTVATRVASSPSLAPAAASAPAVATDALAPPPDSVAPPAPVPEGASGASAEALAPDASSPSSAPSAALLDLDAPASVAVRPRPPFETTGLSPVFGLGGGMRVRDGASAAPIVAFDMGIRLGAWGLAGTLGGVGRAGLVDLAPEVDAGVWGAGALVTVGWRPRWRVAPELGVGAGATYYRFLRGGAAIDGRWVPVSVGTAGVSVGLLEGVRVGVAGRALVDLDELHLRVNGVESGGWSAWSVEPLARVVYEPARAAR